MNAVPQIIVRESALAGIDRGDIHAFYSVRRR